MKKIELAEKAYIKILKGQDELYPKDFRDGLKGCTPGEWVLISCEREYLFAAYVNPFAQNNIVGRVVALLPDNQKNYEPEQLISQNIDRAIDLRKMWNDFNDGCRLIHGQADALPGIIADSYCNGVLVQVNTAGMELYRQQIAAYIEKRVGKQVYFLDHQEYRQNESLPQRPVETLPDFLEIAESGFRYQLPSGMIQKIGYYYDHRHNRQKLRRTLRELNRTVDRGLDLFSYMGSWGLHMLDGGTRHVTFVDQGNFSSIYQQTMTLNRITDDRWDFKRGDVFSLLENFKQQGQLFDLIVSDPPAFKKKEQNKDKALGGYTKLHSRILSLLNPNSLMVVASCTHGISLGELDKTVYEASLVNKRTVQLIDVGIQAPDHPFAHLTSNEHYIKYLLYHVD